MQIREITLPKPGYGVYNKPHSPMAGSNISKTSTALVKKIKKKNIQPGEPEWFQAWFSLPYLTGEKSVK